MPDALKPVLARQMEVYAGFMEHTDHHVGRLIDALEDLGILDDTLIYYIIGDNGASAEGTVNGTFNELLMLNGAAALETPEFMAVAHRRVRDARGVQPLRGRLGARDGHAVPVDQAGRLATGAGRATARSSTGRTASRPRARCATSSTTSSTSPDGPGGGRAARADLRRTASSRCRYEGVSMAYTFDDAAAAERHETQYFEMFVQPRHLPQGLDRGDPAQHAVGDGADCRRSTTTSGSCTPRTTGPRRTTSPPSSRSGCTSCSACS